MKKLINKISLSDIAGIGTLFVIFVMSLYWVENSSEIYKSKLPILYISFLIYLICFILVAREELLLSLNNIILFTVIQLLCAFVLMFNFRIEFLPILTIIWISIIPHYFSLRATIIILLVVLVTWFALFSYIWQQKVFFDAMIYGCFHFFAVLMSYHAIEAEKATRKAHQLNRELETTQQLLTEASKHNERTRIARDLHDLLGHHLTALIINLQVATRLTQGDANDKVEQCHSLAKLLLSDVREAVSTLRENSELNFEQILEQMIENIPNIEIVTSIKTKIPADNLPLAKTLLSCIQEAITNSLRHSSADKFWISLSQKDDSFLLELRDNGEIKHEIVEGNGLSGMRERIKEFGGQISIERLAANNQKESLKITIALPIQRVVYE